MIELLCGPIASGKSTYARKRAETGAIIVNDDAIVLALHAGDYNLYRPELKPIYKAIECTIIHTSLAMGKQVVIDRTNHTRNMRARYIAIAKSLDYQINVIMFNGWKNPKEMAYMRWSSDNRGLSLDRWREVANRHLRQLEWPNLDEGFTEINWENPNDI